jgi:hypothetical protein
LWLAAGSGYGLRRVVALASDPTLRCRHTCPAPRGDLVIVKGFIPYLGQNPP